MAKRKIISIDEEICNGCGNCIPNCPEGALQIIDGKARLISDLFCDGLGACIGECPLDAITVIERDATPYDENKVVENIIKQGPNVIKAHLQHLTDHGEREYLNQALSYLKQKGIENPLEEAPSQPGRAAYSCPGSQILDFTQTGPGKVIPAPKQQSDSQLKQWPVQIYLVPPTAPYFKNADLLIAADCVPFAYPDFHKDFLAGKFLLVGCPKLDDTEFYAEKISQIISLNDLKSITYVHMEVPCCLGMLGIIRNAILESGKMIPLKSVKISIKGKIVEEGF